ncbi:MAG: DNA polymerase IV [Oscillospiraceae bacterium]|nr:DNA polymerase IV [Oscillospiraceae bacterium]
MDRTIIHVDMDAFYAAVEIRDQPALGGKPLIIGALPHERGVVATCSYEARKFGVGSGMSIKTAYQRCPQGIYMHPNMRKYREVSERLHAIWHDYTDTVEYVAWDEGYLDVTHSAQQFGGAMAIALAIKARTKQELGLTCSVGIGYSKTAAKLGSEEKKPDGLFEVPTPAFFVNLILDRNVRALYSVGAKTAEKLEGAGIFTVRDVRRNRQRVADMLGKHGRQIIALADGIDDRPVVHYEVTDAKSIGREITFQQDIANFGFLTDILIPIAHDISVKLRGIGLYGRTVTLKITYGDMKSITRSKSGEPTNQAEEIFSVAADLLAAVGRKPIRLVGISVQNLTETYTRQLTFDDIGTDQAGRRHDAFAAMLLSLQQKYGLDIAPESAWTSAERLYGLIAQMEKTL